MIGIWPKALTGYAGEQLPGKVLNLTAGEWHKAVSLQKIEDTLPQQISHDTDVIAIVKTVPQVDALVAVLLVIGGQCGQHPKFNPRSIPVLLDRADDLDGTAGLTLLVKRFNHLSEGTLPQEFDDRVCETLASLVSE